MQCPTFGPTSTYVAEVDLAEISLNLLSISRLYETYPSVFSSVKKLKKKKTIGKTIHKFLFFVMAKASC